MPSKLIVLPLLSKNNKRWGLSNDTRSTYQQITAYIDAKIEKKPAPINLSQTIKSNLEYKEGDIASVYDAWVKNGHSWFNNKLKPSNWSLEHQTNNIIRPWPPTNT